VGARRGIGWASSPSSEGSGPAGANDRLRRFTTSSSRSMSRASSSHPGKLPADPANGQQGALLGRARRVLRVGRSGQGQARSVLAVDQAGAPATTCDAARRTLPPHAADPFAIAHARREAVAADGRAGGQPAPARSRRTGGGAGEQMHAALGHAGGRPFAHLLPLVDRCASIEEAVRRTQLYTDTGAQIETG
jgi:hypothetical protein